MIKHLLPLFLTLISIFSIQAQNLNERKKNNTLKDSILTYKVIIDSFQTDVKFIRLQLFKKAKFMNGQDLICYDYAISKIENDTTTYETVTDKGLKKIMHDEMTGRIVQGDSIWMHPPRGDYFRVLELNAFPFFMNNQNQWTYDLSFGDHWSDERWLMWTGRKWNKSKYTLLDEEVDFQIKNQTIKCKKIKAISKLEDLGDTESIFYYNEDYGFVYMRFKLINNKILELHLI